MRIALVLIVVAVCLVFFGFGREPIPWTSRLRRVRSGTTRTAEWIAPDAVVEQVQHDYLEAVNWLSSVLIDHTYSCAPQYLMGRFLARFQMITSYEDHKKRVYFDGIFTARHHVQVRQFSEDGSRCLVVDCQTERHMETRYVNQPAWSLGQDMGDGVIVFQMCYDIPVKRWKIESIIQELPAGWSNRAATGHIQLNAHEKTGIGRDN